jgi:RNA polymerase sigma-70 factor (ECF subfamily)
MFPLVTPSPGASPERTPEPPPELREAFHRGERGAIGDLAAAFHGDLARFALSLLKGDERLAEEAVQDAFLSILERHRLYAPERPFRPWLFGVCRNCCREARRAREREAGSPGGARIVPMEELLGEGGEAPAARDQSAATALEELIRREEDRGVAELLGTLPEPSRAVVILRVFEEFSFAEIARILGEPLSTVSNRHYRALGALREAWEARRLRHERFGEAAKKGNRDA